MVPKQESLRVSQGSQASTPACTCIGRRQEYHLIACFQLFLPERPDFKCSCKANGWLHRIAAGAYIAQCKPRDIPLRTVSPPLQGVDSPTDGGALLNLALELVDEGLYVLQDHLTSDAQLTHHSALIPGGTVGKHFRHVAETFAALLVALNADPPHGPLQIDYNALLPSSRDDVAQTLESCRTAMLTIRGGLHALNDTDLDMLLQQPVEVCAITPTRQFMQSTIAREVWFCSLHAIHHYTMIRVIAVHELGLHLPIEFGTAPATIHYRGKGWQAPSVSPPAYFKAKL